MKEILKNEIYDGYYSVEERRYIITKNYKFEYDAENGIIYCKSSLPVKHMSKLRWLLRINNIDYKNIIIGRPDP